MTTAQAAAELGVSVRRVQAMIRSGRLQATKQGRDWHITAGQLDKIRNRKPGRPAKDKQ